MPDDSFKPIASGIEAWKSIVLGETRIPKHGSEFDVKDYIDLVQRETGATLTNSTAGRTLRAMVEAGTLQRRSSGKGYVYWVSDGRQDQGG